MGIDEDKLAKDAAEAAVGAKVTAANAGLSTGTTGDRRAAKADLDDHVKDVANALDKDALDSIKFNPRPAPAASSEQPVKTDEAARKDGDEERRRAQADVDRAETASINEKKAKDREYWDALSKLSGGQELWQLFVSMMQSAGESGEKWGHVTQYLLTSALLQNKHIKAHAGPELEALQKASGEKCRENMPMLSDVKDRVQDIGTQIGQYRHGREVDKALEAHLDADNQAGKLDSDLAGVVDSARKAASIGSTATEASTGAASAASTGVAATRDNTAAPDTKTAALKGIRHGG